MEAPITLIVIGLLLGFVGLLWAGVISIIRGDRQIDPPNLQEVHGPFVDKGHEDTKAA